MSKYRDLTVPFPPKEFLIKIERGEFGWAVEGGFKGADTCIMGTGPTIWSVIDMVTEYINDELPTWSSFDANDFKA